MAEQRKSKKSENSVNNRLVLTGVTNNSGRVVTEKIHNCYAEILKRFAGGIRAVCRSTSDTSHFRDQLPDAEVYICDLTDQSGLTKAFAGADTLLHIAGIHWSKEVVNAAVENSVRRLIVVHTCGVYSKYKAAGEEYRKIDAYVENTCIKNNIALTILRPTMIYGNMRDRNLIKFIKMVDKFPVMPVVNGGQYKLQPIHYQDLAGAIVDVLLDENNTNGKDFILSGERPILLREMLLLIGDCLGKDVKFISCPFWIAYFGAVIIWILTLGRSDYREKVQRLCEDKAFPHESASKAFGFKPRSFKDGIAEEIDDYLSRKNGETE